jgi:hypothetical protein
MKTNSLLENIIARRLGRLLFVWLAVPLVQEPAEAQQAAKSSASPNIVESVGKPPPTATNFVVDTYYKASGIMGDIGDVTIAGSAFVYRTKGNGPQEWDYKYKEGKLNESPAKFGGVVWLSPENNFGETSDSGYDLRGFRKVVFDARSLGDDVNVEFFVGGINWIWKQNTSGKYEKVASPYPDSMPKVKTGIKKITNDWQTVVLSLADQRDDNLRRVVGGFGWTIDWGSNKVELNESGKEPKATREFKFELKNLRYER